MVAPVRTWMLREIDKDDVLHQHGYNMGKQKSK